MNLVYILVNKGKIKIPVSPKDDPIVGLDKVFGKRIIAPAYQKDIFVSCPGGASSLSCDIAHAIVASMRTIVQ